MVGRTIIFAALLGLAACKGVQNTSTDGVYRVAALTSAVIPDCGWGKRVWADAEIFSLGHFMGPEPGFMPHVEGRMGYDAQNLYIIWKVDERYARSSVTRTNGPVWEDSCVEIFFAPDTSQPARYFNFEINAGGTALMWYIKEPRKELLKLDTLDVRKIRVAHSQPGVFDAGEQPTTWYVECAIPFGMLEKYAPVTRPAPGVKWRANLYKTTAEKGPAPHWLTWAEVQAEKPDFHLPQYFGTLVFE